MNGDGSTLNNWTGAVARLGETAGGILGALKNKPNTPAPASQSGSKATWGMIAAIGAGVVLLVVVLLSLGSHK